MDNAAINHSLDNWAATIGRTMTMSRYRFKPGDVVRMGGQDEVWATWKANGITHELLPGDEVVIEGIVPETDIGVIEERYRVSVPGRSQTLVVHQDCIESATGMIRDPSGVEYPATQPLRWDWDVDDDNNTTHEADSFYLEDEDTPFGWSVQSVLVDDSVKWSVVGSSLALLPDDWEIADPFPTADVAKAWCQAAEDRLWRDAVAKGEVRRTDD